MGEQVTAESLMRAELAQLQGQAAECEQAIAQDKDTLATLKPRIANLERSLKAMTGGWKRGPRKPKAPTLASQVPSPRDEV